MIVPPPGYVLKTDLFADFDQPDGLWRFFVSGNLLALIPLGCAAAVVWLPYQLYAAIGAPLQAIGNPQWPQWAYWVFGLAVILGSMIGHEALHGMALKLCGYRPKFGFAMGYLYASIQPGDFLTRRAYLVMILTPITVISLLGVVMLPFLPVALGQIVVMAVLLNAAASVGDLVVASRVRRWPRGTLFSDAGGIKVFVPQISTRPQSETSSWGAN